jgi:hypothetical protein
MDMDIWCRSDLAELNILGKVYNSHIRTTSSIWGDVHCTSNSSFCSPYTTVPSISSISSSTSLRGHGPIRSKHHKSGKTPHLCRTYYYIQYEYGVCIRILVHQLGKPERKRRHQEKAKKTMRWHAASFQCMIICNPASRLRSHTSNYCWLNALVV